MPDRTPDRWNVESACPSCGDVATRMVYFIGSGPELSCATCEWCWGAEGQDLKPIPTDLVGLPRQIRRGRDASNKSLVTTAHVDGVPWWEAPIPRRWHRCRVQSWGKVGPSSSTIYRCPCGAISLDGRVWDEKNTRNPTMFRSGASEQALGSGHDDT